MEVKGRLKNRINITMRYPKIDFTCRCHVFFKNLKTDSEIKNVCVCIYAVTMSAFMKQVNGVCKLNIIETNVTRNVFALQFFWEM